MGAFPQGRVVPVGATVLVMQLIDALNRCRELLAQAVGELDGGSPKRKGDVGVNG